MPVKPAYQSRPSSRIGRQACAAIETRIASVTSRPCAPIELLFGQEQKHQLAQLRRCRKERAAAGRVPPQRVVDAVPAQHPPAPPFGEPAHARKIPHGLRRPACIRNRAPPRSSRSPSGSRPPERALVGRALEFAEPLYAGQVLSTGEPVWAHALGLAGNLAAIGVDATARAAGVLFAAPKYLPEAEKLHGAFGEEIAAIAAGVEKLYQLRLATRGTPSEQNEILRKMVLGMVEDVRVVLIRLASRTQTLRWFSKNIDGRTRAVCARNARHLRAARQPARRRQLKWELEDLSFRFLEPELYKRIAQMLDEKRLEREQYIAQAMKALSSELAAVGVKARDHRPAEAHLFDLEQDARQEPRLLRGVRRARRARDRARGQGLLHRARRGAQPVAADPEGVRRLHLAPQGQPVPVAAHRGARAARQDAGGADPHRGDAPAGRIRRRRALAVQGKGQGVEGVRAEGGLAAPAARLARRSADQEAADRRRHLCAHAAGPGDRPAGRLDADRLRLRAAQRPRPPLPRRAGRRSHRQARHAARQRPARRDRHRQDRRPVARLAEPRARLRQERARAPQDPPVVQRQGARRHRRRRARRGGEGAAARGQTHVNLDALAAKLGFGKPDEMFAAVARDEVNLRQLQVALEGRANLHRPSPRNRRKPQRRQGVHAGRRHGRPRHPARQVLQAGAARSRSAAS